MIISGFNFKLFIFKLLIERLLVYVWGLIKDELHPKILVRAVNWLGDALLSLPACRR